MRSALLVSLLLALAAMAAGEELFIPMVAQKQGQDGAWWNTEVWIANTTTGTGSFGVVFLPAGEPNQDALRAEPEQEDLAPGATVYRDNLVPQGKAGVLRVLASPGIVVLARVFNSAGRGSFGQSVPAMPRSAALRPGEIGHLLGLRRSTQFRTNVGLFNPSGDVGVIRLRLYQGNGASAGEQSYRIAAGGYIQLDDVLHAFAVTRGEGLRAEVSGTVPLMTFASVIDARSGAPTLVSPIR
jgi:hypothetical protein